MREIFRDTSIVYLTGMNAAGIVNEFKILREIVAINYLQLGEYTVR